MLRGLPLEPSAGDTAMAEAAVTDGSRDSRTAVDAAVAADPAPATTQAAPDTAGALCG